MRVTSAEKKHPVDASCAREAEVSRRRTRSQAASQRRRCRSTPSQKGFAEVKKQSFATNLRQIRKKRPFKRSDLTVWPFCFATKYEPYPFCFSQDAVLMLEHDLPKEFVAVYFIILKAITNKVSVMIIT